MLTVERTLRLANFVALACTLRSKPPRPRDGSGTRQRPDSIRGAFTGSGGSLEVANAVGYASKALELELGSIALRSCNIFLRHAQSIRDPEVNLWQAILFMASAMVIDPMRILGVMNYAQLVTRAEVPCNAGTKNR